VKLWLAWSMHDRIAMSMHALLPVLAAITLHEAPNHTTESTLVVDAPPAAIYALVTDYAGWTSFLTDVSGVKVERGGRRDARVRFHSKALDHTVTVQFDNQPDRVIKFVGVEGPPGGRASGSFVLEPLDGGRHTKITASFYLDVVGVAGVFVSDAKIRGMRQAKLRADLTDVLQRLAARPAA
jgi:ribosome-associated toxin RatA of RatAB toxin-antitoxin module